MSAYMHIAQRKHVYPSSDRAFMSRIPLRRPAQPDDVAAAAVFLASDEALYITGVNLFVDGGWEQTAYPDLRRLMEDPS